MERGGKFALRTGGFLLSAAALAGYFAAYGPEGSWLRLLILALGALVAAAAAYRPAWGLSAFLFLLLTANNVPYYFDARHSVVYFPVAGILFGFLAAGWGLRRVFSSGKGEDPRPAVPGAVGKPLGLAAAFLAVSAGVTFWRWVNFYPIRGKEVFDWMTNSNGLQTFWARQSVIMSAAGYLLPFALLWVAAKTMQNRRDVDTVLRTSTAGLGAAVLFGYVQHFASPGFGNTDFWVFLGQINGTFKDPNAFGGVLAILLPFVSGAALDGLAKAKGFWKAGWWASAAAATFLLGIFAFSWIGARSALLAFAAGAAVIAVGAFRLRKKGGLSRPLRRWIAGAAVVFLIAGGILFVRSRLFTRLESFVQRVASSGDLLQLSPERYFLWKHALAMTRNYPLAGVGVGAFIVELPDYYIRDKTPVPAGFQGAQRLDSAENYFLHASAETGTLGLAALIAVFAGLAWEIRRAVRAGILRGPDRWIYLGAAGGLAGFVVNALFHSFAQSFETLFCFWLVAAVIIVLGRREGGEESKKSRRAFGILFAALVAVYAGLNLWHSSRGLSLAAKSAEFGLSQEFGLYRPEQDEEGRAFRWTKDNAAWTVEITGRSVRLPVRISHPDADVRPVRVRVSIGKFLLREETVLGETEWTEPGRKVLEFSLPAGYSGKGMLRLSVDRTWIPRDASDSKDSRRLGAAVEPAEFY